MKSTRCILLPVASLLSLLLLAFSPALTLARSSTTPPDVLALLKAGPDRNIVDVKNGNATAREDNPTPAPNINGDTYLSILKADPNWQIDDYAAPGTEKRQLVESVDRYLNQDRHYWHDHVRRWDGSRSTPSETGAYFVFRRMNTATQEYWRILMTLKHPLAVEWAYRLATRFFTTLEGPGTDDPDAPKARGGGRTATKIRRNTKSLSTVGRPKIHKKLTLNAPDKPTRSRMLSGRRPWVSWPASWRRIKIWIIATRRWRTTC